MSLVTLGASKKMKFRLSQNSIKFNGAARFQETIPIVKSVSSSKIKKNSGFSIKIIILPFFKKIEFSQVLQLRPIERGNMVILPYACYSLTSNEKNEFYKFFKEVKVPDGYASNISRCIQVNDRKNFGLKSHDCHVLMQQLLHLAIRGVLHKNVCAAIVKLCSFFKQLCSKVLKSDQLEHLQNDIIVTLCKLERIFPPSFLML